MIGITGKNIDPFDSTEFGTLFFEVFNARILSYSINCFTNTQQVNLFGTPVVTNMGYCSYEINVICRVDRPASSSSWMLNFHMPKTRQHIVQSVKTTHENNMHQVEIKYLTDSVEDFMRDLNNISYQRFSDKFHSNLDKVLEEEAN